MKRILSLIAFSILFTLTSFAQTRALATLSHQGKLTFFDDISAFEDAVDAAVVGDTIYLSEGRFGTKSSQINILKPITIIGNGYNSHIVPIVHIGYASSSGSSLTFNSTLFDGVQLEKLNFSHYGHNNIVIKKCKIHDFEDNHYTKKIKLDRCYIEKLHRVTPSLKVSGNEFLNCKLDTLIFSGYEIIDNCNIRTIAGGSPSYIINSIIGKTGIPSMGSLTGGIYENCLIGDKSGFTTGSSAPELINCYDVNDSEIKEVLDDNLECTIKDMSKYVGTDGTVIGIYGGQWLPYSETPSVPTVDYSNSSVQYDKENNQLNVTITVAPN